MGKHSANSIKPFIEKNKRHDSFCIYCHKKADTREHVPSKFLLDDPLPTDSIAVVPACQKCNGGYSQDELYVASLVDAIFCATNKARHRDKVLKAFEHDTKLRETVQNAVKLFGDKIEFEYTPQRIANIIKKLALGHIANKLDTVFDAERQKISCEFKFKREMTQNEIEAFEEMPSVGISSEIGADFIQDLLVLVNVESNEQVIISPWHTVQEDKYRFLTNIDKSSCVARIVIQETLYGEVIISDKE